MNPVTCSVVFLLFISLGVSAFNNGRPMCRKPDDFLRDWAVKNDDQKYWRCTGFGTSELRDCNAGRTFSELYAICTIPGAPIGDIDRPRSLIQCAAGEEIDLSGTPSCTKVSCDNGVIVYDSEGHPRCYRDLSLLKLCPGVSEARRVPGTESCTRPKCDSAEYNANRMFPSADPTEFYRCANVNHPVTFKCHPGLCYDAKVQGCVWPADWNNVCA